MDDDEKPLLMPDDRSTLISGSPAPNHALQLVDQLTPISRILQGHKTVDICQTDSPGLSPAPATPINIYKMKIQELEHKVEVLKRDKDRLQTSLMSEQQAKENTECINTEMEQRIKLNDQKLARNKKEIEELRQENDKMWSLTEERDDLFHKNAVYRQRLTKLNEQEDEIAILQRSVQHLTERNSELQQEVSNLNSCKSDRRQLNETIAQQQSTIEEYQVTCSMQEQQLKGLLENEGKQKQEYEMLKELFDAQKLEINANGTATPDGSFFQGETMSVVTQIEVQELKEKLDELQGSWLEPQKVVDLKQKLEESVKGISAEKARYKELFQDYERHLKTISALESENQKLHETINETNEEFQTVQQDLKTISKNADSVIKSHEEVEQELDSIKQTNALLLTDKESLIEKNEALTQTIHNCHGTFKSVKSQLTKMLPDMENANQDLSSAEQNEICVNEFPSQLSEVVEELQTFIQDIKMENAISNKENTELSDHMTSLKEENKSFVASLENLKSLLNTTTTELNKEKVEHANVQSKLVNLSNEYSEYKSKTTKENEELVSELQQVKTHMLGLKNENKELQQKIKDHFSTIQAMHTAWLTPEKANHMLTEIQNTNRKVIELEEKCNTQADLYVEEVATLKTQVESLTSENDRLFTTLEDLRTERNDVEERHSTKCEELEAKLQAAYCNNSQEFASQLETQQAQWKQELESLKAELEESENLYFQKCMDIAKLKHEIDDLQAKSTIETEKNQSLQTENDILQESRDSVVKKNVEMLAENADLTQKLHELNSLLASQERDYANLKQEFSAKESDLQRDLDEMKNKFNELLQTLQESESKNNQSNLENADASYNEFEIVDDNPTVEANDKLILENLKNQLISANTRIEELVLEHAQQKEETLSQCHADTENYTKQADELNGKIFVLETELRHKETAHSEEISRAWETIAHREAEIRRLLEKHKTELLRMREERQEVEERVTEFENRYVTARREIGVKEHEIETSDMRRKEVEQQLVQAKIEHKFAVERLEGETRELRKEKKELEHQLEISGNKSGHYESQIKKSDADLVHQKVEYESRIISLEGRIKQLEFDLSHYKNRRSSVNTCDMNENGTILTPNKLLRSLSEDCLATPTNKLEFRDRVKCLSNDSLNDSLEFIKPHPVMHHVRGNTSSLSSTLSLDTPTKSSLSRSCMSVESSMLGLPNNQQQQNSQPPHAFSTGDLTQDAWHFMPSPSHASNVELSSRRMTMGPSDFMHRQAGRPSLLGLPVLEEPDDPNYSCSLQRIAELQKRNSIQPSHLKSSYPIETQTFSSDGSAQNTRGKTPSKCDETIRVGNPHETMKRMDNMTQPSETQKEDAAKTSERMSIIRGLPGYRSSSSLQATNRNQPRMMTSAAHGTKRKQGASLVPDMQWDITSPKSRRETIAGPFATASIKKFNESNRMENQRITRQQSTMFEIANTPPTNLANRRRRTRKKSPPTVTVTSVTSKSSKKTPEKLPTTRQRKEGGKRTPSLMERMRKPLGRLNPKK
uniref:Early endosome antigen 1-like n=1 Tax=Phallusia mammillata TaxID=59560 RepID=A0A6F9DS48_9ASCI|nr:early endosome antigen 1-like [Phallusia mammillata]